MRTVIPSGFNEDDDLYFKNFKQTQYSGHKKIPTSLAWNPMGDKLVVAQTYVKIWSFDLIYGCQKNSQAKLHQNNVDHVKFGSNNLFGTLSKQSLRFWDIRQSPLKSKKQEKKNKVDLISFCWNLTGSQLENTSENDLKYCILTKDSTITFNDYRFQNKPLKVINCKNINNMDITQIGWDQSNSFFLCAGGENSTGSIILLNGQTFQQIVDGEITSHCGRINHFAISPYNNLIVTASDDSLVQVHQFPEFICSRSYSNKMDNSYQKISFNYNGKYMAVASDGNSIDIFNLQYGGWAHRINTQIQRPIMEWNPKRQILCYIDQKRKIGKNQKMEDCYINILQTQI